MILNNKQPFGNCPDGEKAFLYTISNSSGMYAKISNFGGILQSLIVRDKKEQSIDIVQGFETAKDYHNNYKFIGGVIGRYANAIKNGVFKLNGKKYRLNKNYKNHCIHGGENGFYNIVWNVKPISKNALHLYYYSSDGEEGFPGNMYVGVTYKLTEDNAFELCYEAASDQDTIANFTHHSYFNLCGHKGNGFEEHMLKIDADYFTEVDEEVVTTGVISKVDGTPFDFRNEKSIARDIDAENTQIKAGNGYDHNFVLNGEGFRKVAEVYHPETGIQMDVKTTMPGMQLYSDNDRSSVKGKDGAVYDGRKAICLETQSFPDAPNKPHFLPAVLKKTEHYYSRTAYIFSIRK